MLKAIYEPTDEPCFVNMDYVVDVFIEDGQYIAYTFDNERGAYIIEKSDFEEWERGES